jgi:Flp pilus assembly protein TadD
MGRSVEAQQDFETAIALGSSYAPVALAAKGELLVATNKSREGNRELAKAQRLAKKDARVIRLQAQAAAADGKWTAAEAAWKQLLQLGGSDAAAHRGLSLLYAAPRPERPLDPNKALKHAELACELTSNHDWLCIDALAIAHAANGRFDQAATLARNAAELATGDKRALCLTHATQFESHQSVAWNWKE